MGERKDKAFIFRGKRRSINWNYDFHIDSYLFI